MISSTSDETFFRRPRRIMILQHVRTLPRIGKFFEILEHRRSPCKLNVRKLRHCGAWRFSFAETLTRNRKPAQEQKQAPRPRAAGRPRKRQRANMASITLRRQHVAVKFSVRDNIVPAGRSAPRLAPEKVMLAISRVAFSWVGRCSRRGLASALARACGFRVNVWRN